MDSLAKATKEWNKGWILADNHHVEHWLNGKKLVKYEYGSSNWTERVVRSSFARWPYATAYAKGKIALQNHIPKERA